MPHLVLEARCLPFESISLRKAAEGVAKCDWSPERIEPLNVWEKTLLPCILPFVREGLQSLRQPRPQPRKDVSPNTSQHKDRNTSECVKEREIGEKEEKREGMSDPPCGSHAQVGMEDGQRDGTMTHHTPERVHHTCSALSPREEDAKREDGKSEQVEKKSTNASKIESIVEEGEGKHSPKNAVECSLTSDDMEREYQVVRAIFEGLGELEEAYYRLQDAQEQVHYVRHKMVGGCHSSRPSRHHAEKKENKSGGTKEEDESVQDDHSSEVASSASSSARVDVEEGGNAYSWWPTDEEMELFSSMSKRDLWRTTGNSIQSTAAQIDDKKDNNRRAPEERNEEETERREEDAPHPDSGRQHQNNDHMAGLSKVGGEVKGSADTVQHVKALLQGRTGVECDEEAFFQVLAKEQLQLLLSSEVSEKDTKREETEAKKEEATHQNALQQDTERPEEKESKYRTKAEIEAFWNTVEQEEEGEKMESDERPSPLIAEGMNPDVDIAMCFNLTLGGESCGISTSRILGRHGLHA